MDDASRFIVAYAVYRQAKVENTLTPLEQAIVKYGCPQEILIDGGSQLRRRTEKKDVGPFEQYLVEECNQAYLIWRIPSTNQ